MKKITDLCAAFFLMLLLTVTVSAAGVELSDEKIDVDLGQELTVKITADDAAGRLDVRSADETVATVTSDRVWVDKDTQTITVKGVSLGKTTVEVELYDVASYEEKQLTGTKTLEVNVVCAQHTFSEWEEIKASTCSETGSEKRKCSECGYIQTRELKLAEHKFYTDNAKLETCTEDGYTGDKVCSVCGAAQEGEVIKSKGHKYVFFKCKVCGEKKPNPFTEFFADLKAFFDGLFAKIKQAFTIEPKETQPHVKRQ